MDKLSFHRMGKEIPPEQAVLEAGFQNEIARFALRAATTPKIDASISESLKEKLASLDPNGKKP